MSKIRVYQCELLDEDLAPVISPWFARRERIAWRAKSCHAILIEESGIEVDESDLDSEGILKRG